MTTQLSDERDLTNIDRLRIGALHVEPPFADEDLLDEITALESELERLRARIAELEEQNGRLRAMVDNVVGQSADNLMRAQDAERRIAERQGGHEWRRR